LSLDAGLLDAIDEAAKAHGLTRSAFLASAAREKIEGRAGLLRQRDPARPQGQAGHVQCAPDPGG